MKPEKWLDTRMIKRGNHLIKQALVKWDALPEELVTWEDEDEIQRRFSGSSPARGQPGCQGRRNVRD